MPRRARQAAGGIVYHVLNRGNLRAKLFHKRADYQAFETIIEQARAFTSVEIFAWCLMPNHWHLVLRPRRDGDLADFMRWLTVTHTQRWRARTGTPGEGHLYQGRYKSFPVQTDEHFLSICRYVERNAQAAKLVERAEAWQWSSLWRRTQAEADANEILAKWPVKRPTAWLATVNRPLRPAEQSRILQCIQRSRPYGQTNWQQRTAAAMGLEHTFRDRGRPRKDKKE